MLRRIRQILAAILFTGITLLFLDFTGTLHAWLGWMARIQFLPAVLALNVAVVLPLVVLTLIFGRVYCSVICPLGVMQDLWARLGRRRRRNPYTWSPARNWLRYGFLAVFLIALAAGFNSLVVLLAPYSAYGRIAQHLLAPLYAWGNNLFALLAERADSYAFYRTDVWLKSLPTLLIAAATLVLTAVLAWRNGRTYCNTVCPVGTVLGFLARFSWFKPVIDTDRCVNCRKCEKNCKASCIDGANHRIDYSRCVACMDCLENCSVRAIRYIHPRSGAGHGVQTSAQQPPHAEKPQTRKPQAGKAAPDPAPADTARRNFLTAGLLAAGTTALHAQKMKVDGGLAVIQDKQIPERKVPIVPPGAQGIRHFTQHCTACQLCVSVCPNGVLRPSTDLTRLMQPEMSYERGYCRPECTRCSEVCPAGAIRPLTTADKSATQIGHAVWIRENCLPAKDEIPCGNCARHCPAGAIRMVHSVPGDPNSVRIPSVNTERCIGCGACENLCPARPFSAIYVEGSLRHRTV